VRRIVIVIALVAVVGFAALVLLRGPRGSSSRTSRKTSQTDSAGEPTRATAGRTASRTTRQGKTTGRLQPTSKEERAAQQRRLRAEERRRKREERRRERERQRLLKYARSRSGRRVKKGRKGQYYVVKAIVSLGSESYALIDSRRVREGDVVMGRRIVAILPDRLEVEAFGRRSVVKVGESLLPPTYTARSKGRRT